MNKENLTTETEKKPEGNEAPEIIKSPEELRQDITTKSEKEVDDFKKEGQEELSRFEGVDNEDKEALQELDQEADIAKTELAEEIDEWTDEPPLPDEEKNMESPVEKANIVEITKDHNFEGSTIVKTNTTEGRTIGYALRKNSRGDLEGNEIGYMKDDSVGWVQQLHESDFDKLRKNGILEKYEKTLSQEQDVKFARTEIQETLALEDLEKKAGDFVETLSEAVPNIETAEEYENEYVIPAYQQAKKLKGIIENNNSDRIDNQLEKEKPFNSISSIVKDKKALCVHFLTGYSNANNKTGASGIEVSSLDTFSKRSKEALKQLNTLAGLSPSISTSVFADSHNFDSTWCRSTGQPIGVILREGECTEISANDAASKSASPKSRRGFGDVATADGINELLSPEERKYSQSGYNEFIISEPKIGALFVTTNKPVEKECLSRLLQENDQFGYPLLFERKGIFYQIPREDLEKLLQNSEENVVYVNEYLIDSYKVSREAIRNSILTMEDDELRMDEKQRFDQYVENYDLKPHFDWADELEVAVKTDQAYILNKEIQKNTDREKILTEELETEGQLTKRLTEYFNKNSQFGKYWTEKSEYTYVNGEEYVGFDPIPDDAKVETKEEVTEYWDYEEVSLEEPAVIDDIVGIGELSNFQTEIRRQLYVVKFPSGKIFQQSSEQTNVIEKTIRVDGHEQRRNAHDIIVGEKMEISNNEKKRIGVEHRLDVYDAFRPLYLAINYGENGLIMNQDQLEREINNGNYVTEKTRSKAAAYAFAMAEMCEKDNDLIEAEKWKNTALNMSGNIERYEFIKSKLNSNGTLKLDNNDIANL